MSWIEGFPELAALPDEQRRLLERGAERVALPAGTTIFAPGQPARAFLLVLSGVVKVRQIAAQGREILLYRVAEGESCILTTACLLAQEDYNAEGIAETPVTAIAIGQELFDRLMAEAPSFRRFVLSRYSTRLVELLQLVEEVAFERIDKRLAQKLLERCGGSGEIAITHQDLAVELGSAREVISRHLKEFERRGWLTLTRGRVAIADRAALDRLASAD